LRSLFPFRARIAAAAALSLLAVPAAAQMYPGDNVAVNPSASTRVLLYPDRKHVRVVPPLLQPGAAYPGMLKPIHLHMPIHHRVVARHRTTQTQVARAKPAPAAVTASTAPPPPPAASANAYDAQPIPFGSSLPTAAAPKPHVAKPSPPKPVAQAAAAPRKPAAKVAAAPAPSTQGVLNSPAAPGPSESRGVTTEIAPNDAAIPFSFDSAAPVPPPASAPEKAKGRVQTTIVPGKPSKPAAQTSLALAEPPASRPPHKTTVPAALKGLTKQSEILFDGGTSDPQAPSVAKLKALAGTLNSALDAGAARVQLDAFGGPPGDKSSDSRRLSLKRALAVRQMLIDDGVPASRIDVRAMGGIDDHGNADRVDVYLRAG